MNTPPPRRPTLLLHIEEPTAAGTALWALGFRPFYLLAAVQAALVLPLWVLVFGGQTGLASPLPGSLWHAGEMVSGFAMAVIVGFLFTAGRNWSGQPTPSGGALATLAGLWLLGRGLAFSPWPLAGAAADLTFALAAAAGLGRALHRGGNRRNFFFVGLLVLLGSAGASMRVLALHDAALARQALQFALDVVLFIIAVMAGRVVPMFTRNGVPGTQPRQLPQLERVALGLLLVLAIVNPLPWPPELVGAIALAAAIAHAARLVLWQPARTLRVPLVAVLHIACAWIPLHLLLRALAAFGWVAPSVATHALTAGAIGLLTLAMMTRTARGHTGRPLKADRIDVAIYLLALLAALLRVIPPLLAPESLLAAVQASALPWSLAFALYAVHYGPWLMRPRADGKPG